MPAKVRLFSVEQREWRVFVPQLVRQNLAKVRDARTIRVAIEAYATFETAERAQAAENLLAREAGRQRARRAGELWAAREVSRRRERTIALNADHLARLGISDAQYRERPNYLRERSPQCWACKQSLDSRQDLEHVACGWLVCTCGACGCRHTPRNAR